MLVEGYLYMDENAPRNESNQEDPVIDAVKAQAMLGVSRGTLYNAIRKGELKRIVDDKANQRMSLLFHQSELERFKATRLAEKQARWGE